MYKDMNEMECVCVGAYAHTYTHTHTHIIFICVFVETLLSQPVIGDKLYLLKFIGT